MPIWDVHVAALEEAVAGNGCPNGVDRVDLAVLAMHEHVKNPQSPEKKSVLEILLQKTELDLLPNDPMRERLAALRLSYFPKGSQSNGQCKKPPATARRTRRPRRATRTVRA